VSAEGGFDTYLKHIFVLRPIGALSSTFVLAYNVMKFLIGVPFDHLVDDRLKWSDLEHSSASVNFSIFLCIFCFERFSSLWALYKSRLIRSMVWSSSSIFSKGMSRYGDVCPVVGLAMNKRCHVVGLAMNKRCHFAVFLVNDRCDLVDLGMC